MLSIDSMKKRVYLVPNSIICYKDIEYQMKMLVKKSCLVSTVQNFLNGTLVNLRIIISRLFSQTALSSDNLKIYLRLLTLVNPSSSTSSLRSTAKEEEEKNNKIFCCDFA